jgi:hypothetical protein
VLVKRLQKSRGVSKKREASCRPRSKSNAKPPSSRKEKGFGARTQTKGQDGLRSREDGLRSRACPGKKKVPALRCPDDALLEVTVLLEPDAHVVAIAFQPRGVGANGLNALCRRGEGQLGVKICVQMWRNSPAGEPGCRATSPCRRKRPRRRERPPRSKDWRSTS